MGKDNIKLKKALQLMDRKGLNGLIIYSDGTNNILLPSYLHYFTGFKPLGPRNAVVVSKSGAVALLVEPPWDSIRASAKSWIKDVRGSSEFVRDLQGLLRELKIAGAVGLAGAGTMNQEVTAGLKKSRHPHPGR